MIINIQYPIAPARPSSNTAFVLDHYGLSNTSQPLIIAEDFELNLEPTDKIILFAGQSGSGKSSLMNAVASNLKNTLNLNALALPDIPIIDALQSPPQQAMELLSLCGLGEAHLMLRTPTQLSEGQKYRFRLALAISKQPETIIADEFAATLDRTLAKLIAFNVHRLAHKRSIRFLIATNHSDIQADLNPNLTINCSMGQHPTIATSEINTQKKSPSVSLPKSGSPKVPDPTGLTSLGGIIALTISATSAMSLSFGISKLPLASVFSQLLR